MQARLVFSPLGMVVLIDWLRVEDMDEFDGYTMLYIPYTWEFDGI